MPCPFAQLNSNGIENHIDNECDSDRIIDGLLTDGTSTANGNSNHDKEPLNYTTYLHVDMLLSALKCLSHIDPSDSTSPHVHDEHFFILVHQGK